jgi:hypothetical protein
MMTDQRNTRASYNKSRQHGGHDTLDYQVNNRGNLQYSDQQQQHQAVSNFANIPSPVHMSTPGPTPGSSTPHAGTSDQNLMQHHANSLHIHSSQTSPIIHPDHARLGGHLGPIQNGPQNTENGSFHTPDSPSDHGEIVDGNTSVSYNLAQLTRHVIDFSTSLAAMRIEVNENQRIQEHKLELLETSINSKHSALSTKLDTKLNTYDTIIDSAADLAKSTATELALLKVTVQTQAQSITTLQDQITANDIKSNQAIREVLALANNIEAHQRRWALRIMGLPAPAGGNEDTDQAKYKVLDFIKDNLHVDNVLFDDIDCAHRVGEVIDSKQPMLFRCHSRDLIQVLLKNRFRLKGSEIVLYEDCTYHHKQLMKTLKDDPRIESSWIYNGAVWAKMAANSRIAKFTLLDDIQTKITAESTKTQGRPNQRQTHQKNKQRTTWKKLKRQPRPEALLHNDTVTFNTNHTQAPNYSHIAATSIPTQLQNQLQSMNVSSATATNIPAPLFNNSGILQPTPMTHNSSTTVPPLVQNRTATGPTPATNLNNTIQHV